MSLKKHPNRRPSAFLGEAAIGALAYASVGWVSLAYMAPFGPASSLFPAAALALAFALQWRRSGLLAVWIGALLLHLAGPWLRELPLLSALPVAALMASAACLQAWTGAWLIRRFLGPRWQAIRSFNDAVRFLLLGGLLGCTVSAGLSMGSLHLYGLLPADERWFTFWNWFLGDALGVILFTSPVLSLLNANRSLAWRSALRPFLVPTLICIFCCVALSGSARIERLEQTRQFDNDNDLLVQQIKDRLTTHREVVAALARFIEIKPNYTPEEFEHFTASSLRDNSDIFALSYNPQVSQAQRAEFERQLRQRTKQTDAGITERNAQRQPVPAADRPSYVVVQDIVPLAQNRPALGYNIASDPIRSEAIELAIRTGKMSTTAPVKLVQEKKDKRGILELVPVLAQSATDPARQIIGFAVAVVKVDEMIELAARKMQNHNLDWSLLDANAPSDRNQLSAPTRDRTFLTASEPLSQTSKLDIGQREWHLTVSAGPSYLKLHQGWRWSGGIAVLLLTLLSSLIMIAFNIRQKLLQENAHAIKALKDSYGELIDNSPLAIIVYSVNSLRILMLNAKAKETYGWNLHDYPSLSLLDFLPPQQRSTFAADTLSTTRERCVTEQQHITQTGTLIHVRSHSSDIEYMNFFARMEIVEDITQVKEYEYELNLANTVFHHCSEAIVITNESNQILSVNPAFNSITGYARDEVLGQNIRLIKSGEHGPDFYQSMWQLMLAHGKWEGEIWNRRKNGERYLVYLRLVAVNSTIDNRVINYVGTFTDITERKKAEEQIEFIAFHDPLTLLSNRKHGIEGLDNFIRRAQRHDCQIAVIFVDLDKFKQVNDVYGHANGDLLLQQVAQRLMGSVRKTDIVCRLAGDEFLVVLDEVRDVHAATLVAKKILELFSVPFELSDNSLHMSCSLGLAIYPHDGQNAQTLIQHADLAMYEAKKQGRNSYRFFDAQMNQSAAHYVTQVAQLRRALVAREFELHYQPQIDLHDHRLVGVEALIRWNHPQLGLLTPADFLGAAEESGLIIEIGEWVLREACRQAVQWQATGHPTLRMAVNLSTLQLQRGDLVQTVREILRETQLDASRLEIELTEAMLLDSSNQIPPVLQRLQSLGVQLSIDDFGTGYSSLMNLHQLKVSRIKIDKSFVAKIDRNEEQRAIVSAIIQISKSLKLRSIAEGVESAEVEKVLRELGCNEAQGYHFCKPLSAQAISSLFFGQPPLIEDRPAPLCL